MAIDEKKLIEAIVNTPTNCLKEYSVSSIADGIAYGSATRQNEIIDIINEQPKVREWIPVSSGELPKTDTYIFLSFENFPYLKLAETDCGDYYPDWFEIDPKTLCRYTGLTDKNGKKIWENDILSCGGNLVVTWKENLASFCLSKKGWLYQHFFGEAVEANDIVVIGNIFDNPELLEGGADHE